MRFLRAGRENVSTYYILFDSVKQLDVNDEVPDLFDKKEEQIMKYLISKINNHFNNMQFLSNCLFVIVAWSCAFVVSLLFFHGISKNLASWMPWAASAVGATMLTNVFYILDDNDD